MHGKNLYSCMMANTVDDGVDYDLDNLTNIEEKNYYTDPCVFDTNTNDTDNDGIIDSSDNCVNIHTPSSTTMTMTIWGTHAILMPGM